MTKNVYGRRIDLLREQAAQLGISKEEARKYGSLAKIATWERAVAIAKINKPEPAAHPKKTLKPQTQQKLQPSKIICPTCLGRSPLCNRCDATGKIFNVVRFRLRYFGSSRLPVGLLP
ncbi:MAG TPA: hypothetical protein VK211_21070 [Kamptonema sp.]|nr:hypothetical protein [Kamptonema sp.]